MTDSTVDSWNVWLGREFIGTYCAESASDAIDRAVRNEPDLKPGALEALPALKLWSKGALEAWVRESLAPEEMTAEDFALLLDYLWDLHALGNRRGIYRDEWAWNVPAGPDLKALRAEAREQNALLPPGVQPYSATAALDRPADQAIRELERLSVLCAQWGSPASRALAFEALALQLELQPLGKVLGETVEPSEHT